MMGLIIQRIMKALMFMRVQVGLLLEKKWFFIRVDCYDWTSKGIQTIYQSLDDIKVEKGNQVKQGNVIGKAGNNVYQSTLKKHLHFIVSIDDKTVNPDKYFNQKIEKIKTTSW